MPQKTLEQMLLERSNRIEPNDKEFLTEIGDFFRGSRPVTMEPPPASIFQPDPLVVGDARFAKRVERLLRMDPGTKQRVKSVTQGHTQGSMLEHIMSGLNPDDFGNTNLTGIFDTISGEIGIDPESSTDFDAGYKTLVHELAHAAGADENRAREAEKLTKLRKTK